MCAGNIVAIDQQAGTNISDVKPEVVRGRIRVQSFLCKQCKNGDPQVLDKLLEKKLLPGVKNSVEFEYQHYILCFMLALCTFLTKIMS